MLRVIHAMNGRWGRGARLAAGLALIGLGLGAIGSVAGAIIAVVGLVPLAMGVWGHCLLEPLAPRVHSAA